MTRIVHTRASGQRRCKHCKELYVADVRNRRLQKYCGKVECRRVSKKASQDRWLRSAKGQGYFRGPENVERVRQWRRAHPGYGRRKAPESPLQDISPTQAVDIKGNIDAGSSAGNRIPHPLQDVLASQPALLIGLIANLTGSLQDDIAEILRRFIHSGQDILGQSR